ncbi:hypothetical protein ACE193_15235 [Bernardetia sp. OM2101]|uniref:hypothetical protein n=1 Tax=Bernardetia sp. OM2101 TaxID=3344876 RepID=UPI0035CFB10C
MKIFREKVVRKVLRQPFELEIGTDGATVSETFRLDQDIVCVTGISLSSDDNERLVARTKVNELRIDNFETIRDVYADRFFHSENVAANSRMYDISQLDKDLEGIGTQGTREVNVSYTDNGAAGFATYTVRLYLECYVLA